MGSQCYLPPGRSDIPALTPAEVGTRLSDPGGRAYSKELFGVHNFKSSTPPLAAYGASILASSALDLRPPNVPAALTPMRQQIDINSAVLKLSYTAFQ